MNTKESIQAILDLVIDPPAKRCGCCGSVHLAPPADARIADMGDAFDGLYWECACGSTLFLPARKIQEAA